MRENPIHFTDDLASGRKLQALSTRPLTIFSEQTGLLAANPKVRDIIRRNMDIITNFIRLLMKVQSTGRIIFPANKSLCKESNSSGGSAKVEEIYTLEQTDADLGIFLSITTQKAQQSPEFQAEGLVCVALNSTRRPIWGQMTFNASFIEISLNPSRPNTLVQLSFQRLVFATLHQFVHLLGFAPSLFNTFNTADTVYRNVTNPPTESSPKQTSDIYLTTRKIKDEISSHFGCTDSLGLETEDSSNSHWEKHHVGDELMIAILPDNPYISRFTLALLDSTGWYQDINYSLAEPTLWGKDKGCRFLNSSNCDFEEFCHTSNSGKISDGTTLAKCKADPLLGKCLINQPKRCIGQNVLTRSVKKFNLRFAYSEGASDFYEIIQEKTPCYETVCTQGPFGNLIPIITIGQSDIYCTEPNEKQPSSVTGIQKDLYCPSDFSQFCSMNADSGCSNNCQANGICNNGKCLCFRSQLFTPSCQEPPRTDFRRLLQTEQTQLRPL